MSQLFHPELINEPFGDPGLYVDLQHRDHALLFDMGDLVNLPSRKMLRIRHAFVSHTHMDHFCGFDRLLRHALGQPRRLHMTGPDGFIANVQNKLNGYVWNLGNAQSVDCSIEASEFSGDGLLRSARFRFRNGFRKEALGERQVADDVILDVPGYQVSAVHLDHHIPCLGFAVREKHRLNVWRTRVIAMQLGVGPWLDELKQAILCDAPDDTLIAASWVVEGERRRVVHPLGKLRGLVQITPGQKIAYVTDVGFTPGNVDRIIRLARNADNLFIESAFLHIDADMALQKMHLTARQAGEIARLAGVRRFQQFHFSPRYIGEAGRLTGEAVRASGLPGSGAEIKHDLKG